jgi:transposase
MVSTMKMMDTILRSRAAESIPGVKVNRTGRRTYSTAYKRALVAESEAPGVSVAGVALAHRINANLLRRWIVRETRARAEVNRNASPVLVPVSLPPMSPTLQASIPGSASTSMRHKPADAAMIEIELNGARIRVRGGVDTQALRAVLEVLSRR